jgi:hypothetical protein
MGQNFCTLIKRRKKSKKCKFTLRSIILERREFLNLITRSREQSSSLPPECVLIELILSKVVSRGQDLL